MTAPRTDTSLPETSDLQRLARTELSRLSRTGHVVLLLAAAGSTTVVASLWLTEPALPARTSAAFAVMTIIGLAWVAFALWVLRNKVPGFPLRDTLHSLGRMAFAGVLAAETMWVIGRLVGSDDGLGALLQLTVAGTLGVLVYIGVLLALRAPELSSLSQRLPGRRTAGVQ